VVDRPPSPRKTFGGWTSKRPVARDRSWCGTRLRITDCRLRPSDSTPNPCHRGIAHAMTGRRSQFLRADLPRLTLIKDTYLCGPVVPLCGGRSGLPLDFDGSNPARRCLHSTVGGLAARHDGPRTLTAEGTRHACAMAGSLPSARSNVGSVPHKICRFMPRHAVLFKIGIPTRLTRPTA
jgi:hypothetical protein